MRYDVSTSDLRRKVKSACSIWIVRVDSNYRMAPKEFVGTFKKELFLYWNRNHIFCQPIKTVQRNDRKILFDIWRLWVRNVELMLDWQEGIEFFADNHDSKSMIFFHAKLNFAKVKSVHFFWRMWVKQV